MTVIAMTREMGTLGKEVALGLAEELGLGIVQHEVVEHVADKIQRPQSEVNRFLEGTARGLARWRIDAKDVAFYTAEEIVDIAAEGNVLIRGWGATYVLRPVSHVLCLRVCAPLAFRTRVMMERLGIRDEEIVTREIERNDAAHARAMLKLFHLRGWQDPTLYHLVLNTSYVPVAHCVALVKELVRRPEFQPTSESRSKLAALKLESRIRGALRDSREAAQFFRLLDIELEPDTGTVTLHGVVTAERFRREVERLVSGVSGVQQVENRLVVSADYWT